MKYLIFAAILFVSLTQLSSAMTKAGIDIQKQAAAYSLVLNESNATGKSMQADLIRFRTQIEAGIEIPVIANFSIIPEIEFYFNKK